MACSSTAGSQTPYYLEAGGTGELNANANTVNVCTATKILDRLHREFTEQYVATTTTGRTLVSIAVQNNPTFYLRKQPKLNGFQGEAATAGNIYRLYNFFIKSASS